jgi:hypothetical protein
MNGIVADQRNRRIATVAVLVGLMGATLFFGLQAHPSSFDDAYITYRYAQNIAAGRGFVYNDGESVLGTTTPLYTLLLAGLSFLVPDIPLLSHYLGMLAWMLCIPLIYGIGRTGGREAVGLVAAALIAFNPLFARVLGMETNLYVLFALATFYLYLKGRPIAAGFCASLSFLTRWDGILVVAVLLFAEMLKGKRGFFRAGLVCACVIVPWLVYSYVTFGSIFPNSFHAKLGQGWNQNLGGEEIGPFARGLVHIGVSAYEASPLFLIWIPLAVLGLASLFYHRFKWWPLLLWTLLYMVGYIALGVLRYPWYYPPVVPAFVLLVASGIDLLAQFVSRYIQWSASRAASIAALGVLCLIPSAHWLVQTQRTEIDPHSATYFEVGNWLQANTPPGSSVALLEIGIVGFYSDRTVVDTMGLVSPDMVGHLDTWLQTLQFAINHYWPDYVVALERTAWMGVVGEHWFREAYALETEIENDADPVAPARIFHRRSGFPPREFVLDSAQDFQLDGTIILHRMQVVDNRVRQGENLQAELQWSVQADVDTDYRFHFELANTIDGQRWTLASHLQPMRGGNPTTQWRAGDQVVDGYSLTVPDQVPSGSYWLQLVASKEDGPVTFSDRAGNTIERATIGKIAIGTVSAVVGEPAFPTNVSFADNISLTGYDLLCTAAEGTFSLILYWEATDRVSKNYTVFVHLLSPDDELVAQHDGEPLLPTTQWTTGTRVPDMHVLQVPPGQRLSDHKVRLGLYHWPDMERVPIDSASCQAVRDAALLLGTIHDDGSQPSTDPVCPGVWWRDALDSCGPAQSYQPVCCSDQLGSPLLQSFAGRNAEIVCSRLVKLGGW